MSDRILANFTRRPNISDMAKCYK